MRDLDQMSDILDEVYGSPQAFVSAYSMDPDKVFRKFVSKMKVVPITLKADLQATYESATFKPDVYVS